MMSLVGQTTKMYKDTGLSKPMFLYCVIHQISCSEKYVDMSCVSKYVVSIINFIHCHILNDHKFQSFLEKCDSEYVGLHITLKFDGSVVVRFFYASFIISKKEIDTFLTEKRYYELFLSDTEWH